MKLIVIACALLTVWFRDRQRNAGCSVNSLEMQVSTSNPASLLIYSWPLPAGVASAVLSDADPPTEILACVFHQKVQASLSIQNPRSHCHHNATTMGVQKKTRKFAQMKRVIGESSFIQHSTRANHYPRSTRWQIVRDNAPTVVLGGNSSHQPP